MGIYKTPDEAETALKALYDWLNSEAYAVYEVKSGGDVWCRLIMKMVQRKPLTFR